MVGDLLFLDLGNSRLKYYWRGEFGILESLPELKAFIKSYQPGNVVYSSVSSLEADLVSLLMHFQISYFKAEVKNGFFGLNLAYSDISKLGVDRWLAMLAVVVDYQPQPVTVVNAGTALTIDCIDQDKVHLGGSISPGYMLSAKALHNNTAQLPDISHEPSGGLGTDTTSCMNYGIVQSMVSLVEATAANFNPNGIIVIGGGDAEFLASQMRYDVIVIPELVLRGLKVFYQQSVKRGVE
ncbi:MAG: type III pantothenate kinase [Reinekea sp.]|jgi:type III pantothenate kinase